MNYEEYCENEMEEAENLLLLDCIRSRIVGIVGVSLGGIALIFTLIGAIYSFSNPGDTPAFIRFVAIVLNIVALVIVCGLQYDQVKDLIDLYKARRKQTTDRVIRELMK